MSRRKFIKQCGILGTGALSTGAWNATFASALQIPPGEELKSDIVIIGGGLGACAAALAASRNGASVIMTEATDWIGEYYLKNYPLSGMARNAEFLNPGNGAVSRICHEPAVSAAVLESMLAPAMEQGLLRILLNTEAVEVYGEGDSIRAVSCRSGKEKRSLVLQGTFFIDASEEGDLLKLSGCEYFIGAESQEQTGERHAPEKEDPANIQALTWCFAMDHLEGEDFTMDPPDMYSFWKDYIPSLQPAWPGKLLSLT